MQHVLANRFLPQADERPVRGIEVRSEEAGPVAMLDSDERKLSVRRIRHYDVSETGGVVGGELHLQMTGSGRAVCRTGLHDAHGLPGAVAEVDRKSVV